MGLHKSLSILIWELFKYSDRQMREDERKEERERQRERDAFIHLKQNIMSTHTKPKMCEKKKAYQNHHTAHNIVMCTHTVGKVKYNVFGHKSGSTVVPQSHC